MATDVNVIANYGVHQATRKEIRSNPASQVCHFLSSALANSDWPVQKPENKKFAMQYALGEQRTEPGVNPFSAGPQRRLRIFFLHS